MKHENLSPGQTRISKVRSTSFVSTFFDDVIKNPLLDFFAGLLSLGVVMLVITAIQPVVRLFSGSTGEKSPVMGSRYSGRLGSFSSRNLTFCSELRDVDCLQPAPHPPFRVAAVTFQDSAHANAAIVFVLTSHHISLHVVDHLPDDALKKGIVVTSGVHRPIPPGRPLIFRGDVNIETGPLVGENEMLSLFSHRNSRLKSIETLYTETPRGPPSKDISPMDLSVQVVYVIGNVRHYEGPTQTDHSSHSAAVIDLNLLPTQEQSAAYQVELRSWRQKLAEYAGIDESLLFEIDNERVAADRIALVDKIHAYLSQTHNDPLPPKTSELGKGHETLLRGYKAPEPRPMPHPVR